MNNIELSGTLWEPLVIATKSGKDMYTANMSVYEGKDKDGKARYSNYKLLSMSESLIAGHGAYKEKARVIVTGRIAIDQYTTKEGQLRLQPTIWLETMRFDDEAMQRDRQYQDQQQNYSAPAPVNAPPQAPPDEDDLPF